MESVKLFVGGFPLEIDELELAKLFGPHGDISTIKIVRDKKTRICKGYAFIEMSDRTGAEAAAEALDGADMNGKQLTVKINEETAVKPAYAPKTLSPQRHPVYRKVSRPATEERKKRPRRSL
ncbi:RNA recognition motif domain-containing protein [Mucilaginibacter auburnensis]|uniref:RNA recognition motif-containing protein n=1 Tax=Mucilaginibacter auburnensis TaxID=1457233 RepID=A0A2H9VUZ1_9SPHI|nr:RNA-binding protein [Mucilaginibacter auburnensis]PJJ84644.1 RNA recognition motif-containing protein [Mucilaginibacter auburnensis]